jgi:asparagine synthase (glutamine-hydrolysing)
MADVPIGIFLSGGLDSSTLVAYMSSLGKKVKTFSVGFGDKTDETKYAKVIAQHFKTEHYEIKLTKDILKNLPEVIWYNDEPLADPACLPTYLLCKEVSKHVKVVLSGEGGDEVFGGYHTYTYAPYLQKYFFIPSFIRQAFFSPLCSLFSRQSTYPYKQMFHLAQEISNDSSLAQAYERLFYFPFTSEEQKEIYSFSFSRTPLYTSVTSGCILRESALRYYFEEWLPNDLLMKADKMGMAHGLEIRTPFLDKNLIDYFLSTPFSARHNRALFRKTVSSHLPSAILKKPKQGFTLPLSIWFTDPEMIIKIKPYIASLIERNLFNKDIITHLITYPTEHRADHKLWVLLVFELWAQLYIDGKPLTEVQKKWQKNLK